MKHLLLLLLLITVGYSKVYTSRYVDDFGDKTGDKYVCVLEDASSYFNMSGIGKLIIEGDGSVEFRTSTYLTTQTGSRTIKFRDNFDSTIECVVNTYDKSTSDVYEIFMG